MTKSPSRAARVIRRGSALVLVLIMTLSLAGLAISAIYLSSSAGLLTRYYDRERDYRYAAEAALALGKSRVMNDTLLILPQDTAMVMLSAATLTDASGAAIPRIRVNLYAAYTGDTTGKWGQFVTLVAQAYDSGGTRHVRRLDLVAESFAKYAMFTNISPSSYNYGAGEFLRGRGHSNQGWNSTGPGGPHYYDTISAVLTVSGPATYDKGYLQGVAPIPYPTVPKLSMLAGYATTGNMNIAPVFGTSGGSRQGTRLEFIPIDINSNGLYEEPEGFFRVYDIALGQDTARLRADMVANKSSLGAASPVALTDSVLNNQCGAFYKFGSPGKVQFIPVASHVVGWVTDSIKASTLPAVSVANAIKMADRSTVLKWRAAMVFILSQPGARCYPAGDPHLLLTERFTDAGGTWNKSSPADSVPWGVLGAQHYGGQDSTFSEVTRDCVINPAVATGRCVAGSRKDLGAWRTWPGTALSAWPTPSSAGLTPKQANEKAYEWPMTQPYNLTSKGVIHTSGHKIYLSGVFRGDLTLYSDSGVTWVDDLTYDQDPAAPSALCRNMLGIIAGDSLMLADNSINRPREVDGGPANNRFLGPNQNFILHAILLSLRGTITTENASGNTALTPTSVTCPTGDTTGTYGTSGGCWFQTGGSIMVQVNNHYTSSANSGLREGRTLDPCQLTNKRPAFFPSTMKFKENKYYEIDPVYVDSWTQVKNYYSRLRGRVVP